MTTLSLEKKPYNIKGIFHKAPEPLPRYTTTHKPYDGLTDEDKVALKKFVEKVNTDLDNLNYDALEKISALHDALEYLEKTPQDYKALCKDGDVESLIKQIETNEKEEKETRKDISSIAERLKGINPTIDKKLKEADENLYDIIALLQEIRWHLLIADAKNQPGPDKVFNSVKDALDDLWS